MPFVRLFWGSLFVLIDFRIQGFDIFPDMVGYILMATALMSLADTDSRFRRALHRLVPLTVLAVLELIPFGRGGALYCCYARSAHDQLLILATIGLMSTVLKLALFYDCLSGTARLARRHDRQGLANIAMMRWRMYLYTVIGGIVLLVLLFSGAAVNSGEAIFTITLTYFVFSLFVFARLAQTFWRAHVELEIGARQMHRASPAPPRPPRPPAAEWHDDPTL